MDKELGRYFSDLARKLRLDPATNREIELELQSHLDEKVRELQEEGLTYREALSQALRDMGKPDLIAQDMYSVHSKGSWRDILLATLPHLLLASLFALHLWTRYTLVAVLLAGAIFITLRGWKAGRSKWTYSWLGYCMAAPAISWLFALGAIGYGAWEYVTTGDLPLSVPTYILILAYIPFSLWIMGNVVLKVVRQDWLLASLTALPFPFLTTWILFLNWQGGLFAGETSRFQETDGDRALIFLALAVTTGVFLKVGRRLIKIGLLTLSTVLLVVVTVVAVPLAFNLLAVILIMLASVAFLLSPAVLQSRMDRKYDPYMPVGEGRGEVNHWFTNTG